MWTNKNDTHRTRNKTEVRIFVKTLVFSTFLENYSKPPKIKSFSIQRTCPKNLEICPRPDLNLIGVLFVDPLEYFKNKCV